MSEMRRALKECMSDVTVAENEISAKFRFDAGFPGFAGHFPGSPLLPGVCLVEAAALLAGPDKALKRLTQLKFFRPLKPGDEAEFQVTDCGGAFKAAVSSAGEKICTMTMEFQ